VNEHANWTTFPADSATPSEARRWVIREIGAGHVIADDAALLVSEAVTNGVRHGTNPEGEGRVTVGLGLGCHLLKVEVIDDGQGGEPYVIDDPDAEGGRGMRIIASYAKEWDYSKLPDGRGHFRFTLAF
jgi:anti-sigma regulatory factor (Ser/Thr protein kinase)